MGRIQGALAAALMLGVACGPALAADWRVTAKTSELDGAKTATAMLDSVTELPNAIGRPETATLVVRCRAKVLEAYIAWPGFLGIDTVRGGYKIDDAPAVMNEGFSNSSSGNATFFYARNLPKTLNAMMAGKRLVVRVEPSRYAPQEASWDLGDAKAAIGQVVQTCT
jgi:hypothetical protein